MNMASGKQIPKKIFLLPEPGSPGSPVPLRSTGAPRMTEERVLLLKL